MVAIKKIQHVDENVVFSPAYYDPVVCVITSSEKNTIPLPIEFSTFTLEVTLFRQGSNMYVVELTTNERWDYLDQELSELLLSGMSLDDAMGFLML